MHSRLWSRRSRIPLHQSSRSDWRCFSAPLEPESRTFSLEWRKWQSRKVGLLSSGSANSSTPRLCGRSYCSDLVFLPSRHINFLVRSIRPLKQRGRRALLLVDALNEGAGARLWRPEIAAILQQVQRYQSIAIVLACRSDNVDHLVPAGLLKTVPRIEVRGFETDEEQAAAARVYLDKRGISRPSTPWLAPEFVNPLFLRSCCNALQREGRREFPRGLAGTKAILSFYLESVARHLGVDCDGSDELVGPTNRSLTGLASIMATTRRNYVPFELATEAAAESFRPFKPPESLTWVDVLQRNGLLRLDPDPDTKADDPLAGPLDVVRFSFQRFQDHLMADALLADVVDVRAALADAGSLAFVRTTNRFQWEWRGLIEALSIQIPERGGHEFIDALPGGARRWWSVHFAPGGIPRELYAGVRPTPSPTVHSRSSTSYSKTLGNRSPD